MHLLRPLRSVPLAALVVLLAACSVVDSILPPPAPVAVISADPPSNSVPAPATVTFDAGASTGRITGYRWLIDGVLMGTTEVMEHTFSAAGIYEVTLEVIAGERQASTQLSYTVRSVSGFNITLVFEEGSFTTTQQEMIRAAADRWEQLVVGDIPDNSDASEVTRNGCLAVISPDGATIAPELQGVGVFDDLLVYVYLFDEDSSTLARAGPCTWSGRLPNYGSMMVNQRRLDFMTSSQSLEHVAIHELGHVLGIGTIWRARADQLLRPGLTHCNDSALDPELPRTYKGALAVGEFNDLGGVGEPPVAPGCGHWHQQTFVNESMVPSRVINPDGDNLTPVSRVTLGSLHDLGYVVAYEMADAYTLPLEGAHLHTHGELYHHGEPYLLTPELPAD